MTTPRSSPRRLGDYCTSAHYYQLRHSRYRYRADISRLVSEFQQRHEDVPGQAPSDRFPDPACISASNRSRMFHVSAGVRTTSGILLAHCLLRSLQHLRLLIQQLQSPTKNRELLYATLVDKVHTRSYLVRLSSHDLIVSDIRGSGCSFGPVN